MRKLEYVITEKDNNRLLGAVLKSELNISSTLLKRLKQTQGAILLNGENAFVNERVKTCDIITIEIPTAEIKPEIKNATQLEILYEDEDYIAINKPSGIICHPLNGSNELTVLDMLKNHGATNIISRLDRYTSGVMLIAKSGYIHSIAKKCDLSKEYVAVIEGEIENECGIITAPIARSDESIIKRVVSESGKEAITEYSVIGKTSEYSFVKLNPITGRTHQLRVHLSHIGHPICGDFLYGHEGLTPINRCALHSYKLTFTHAVTKQVITVIAPIPEDMLNLINIVGNINWLTILSV